MLVLLCQALTLILMVLMVMGGLVSLFPALQLRLLRRRLLQMVLAVALPSFLNGGWGWRVVFA